MLLYINKSKNTNNEKKKKTVLLLTHDAVINQRKIMKWYEYKSNFL